MSELISGYLHERYSYHPLPCETTAMAWEDRAAMPDKLKAGELPLEDWQNKPTEVWVAMPGETDTGT
jgi:hypothetical protein